MSFFGKRVFVWTVERLEDRYKGLVGSRVFFRC